MDHAPILARIVVDGRRYLDAHRELTDRTDEPPLTQVDIDGRDGSEGVACSLDALRELVKSKEVARARNESSVAIQRSLNEIIALTDPTDCQLFEHHELRLWIDVLEFHLASRDSDTQSEKSPSPRGGVKNERPFPSEAYLSESIAEGLAGKLPIRISADAAVGGPHWLELTAFLKPYIGTDAERAVWGEYHRFCVIPDGEEANIQRAADSAGLPLWEFISRETLIQLRHFVIANDIPRPEPLEVQIQQESDQTEQAKKRSSTEKDFKASAVREKTRKDWTEVTEPVTPLGEDDKIRRQFTPSQLAKCLHVELKTIGRYADAAAVARPKRGGRDSTYSGDNLIQLLDWIVSTGKKIDSEAKAKAGTLLESLDKMDR